MKPVLHIFYIICCYYLTIGLHFFWLHFIYMNCISYFIQYNIYSLKAFFYSSVVIYYDVYMIKNYIEYLIFYNWIIFQIHLYQIFSSKSIKILKVSLIFYLIYFGCHARKKCIKNMHNTSAHKELHCIFIKN